MKKFLWMLEMISGLPLIILVGPVLGVWVLARSWANHWRENWNAEIRFGVWSVPKRAFKDLD